MMGADAVMESQIVVDHTEVDENGFVIGHVHDESHPMEALWAQIASLERRALSRDYEASLLDEKDGARDIYMLSLESRALRSQARVLRNQRMDLMTRELGCHLEAGALKQLGRSA